ncbi:hypothetical protein [Zunongwangia profunda]|nr:hypothetical protein [Zunongwangia profunda]
MLEQLKKLSAMELLDYYVHYLNNRDKYSPEEQEKIDRLFEDI